MSPKDAVAAVGMVVEGINALGAAVKLAEKYDVQMPITTAVNSIINHGADPADTVRELMRREMKQECIY